MSREAVAASDVRPPEDAQTLRSWLERVIADEMKARRALFASPVGHTVVVAIGALFVVAIWSSWGAWLVGGPRWPVTVIIVALTAAEVSLFFVVRYLGGVEGRAWRVWAPIQSGTLPMALFALIYLGGTPLTLFWLWIIFICIEIPQEPRLGRQNMVLMVVGLLALVAAVAWRDGLSEALVYLLIGLSAVFVMVPLHLSFRQRRIIAAQNLWLSERLEREAVLRERDRIQRDLHDGLAGGLSGLLARIRTTEGLDDATRDQLAGRAGELVAELRDLVWLGREPRTWPAWLERLERALRALPSQDVELTVEVVGAVPGTPIDASRGQHLAVCARELVFNALRHGEPGTVVVRVIFERDGSQDRVALTVEDDGRGFDVDAVERRGLANVARRTRALDGAFDVHSGADGTRITLRAPV